MNKDALKQQISILSEESKVDYNTLLSMYFMECFLKRLASSQYSNCFIVKGGFLLSSILGVKKRTTVDIDFSAQSISISPDNLLVIINEIISIDQKDSISYECIDILPIRKTDEYGGNQICLIAHLDNIRHRINVDIATGDPITPSAINYVYETLFSKETISVLSYNIETILAEKFQTIIDRSTFNSRMKDFYDLYTLFTLYEEKICIDDFKAAVKTTFLYRSTSLESTYLQNTIQQLETSLSMEKLWNNYTKKHSFANLITYLQITQCLYRILELI